MGLVKGIYTCLIKVPLSVLYGIGVYIRNKLYDWKIFKSVHFEFPVINIGNVMVGGTGKTPHVEFLLSFLTSKYTSAVLSRGYKRKSKGFRYVECTDNIYMAGDEPLQIKQKYPHVTVAVDANRAEGINKLIKDNNAIQLIVLDDAFQHRKITVDLNIILVDYNKPVYTDHFLPWGQLRDNESQLRRAEIVIITKCPDDIQPIDLRMMSNINVRPCQQLYFTSLEYSEKEPVFNDIDLPDTLLEGEGTVVVTGIASPAVFLNYVKKCFGKIRPLLYPDHHNFTKADIQQICKEAQKAAIVLTTEKDSIRLRQWGSDIPPEIKAKMFYVPITIKFLKDEDKFIEHIFDYVRTNKSNSRLY
ncbi:MAG: tetraacyldisaccharide 4'-kinase [Prevotellaceae bacterium]|jgi:tetraacyldisaccharide 4'-kinase|nr:tetraacyldisaccharide 4'-kinase [Prevotellaceae bacterium]